VAHQTGKHQLENIYVNRGERNITAGTDRTEHCDSRLRYDGKRATKMTIGKERPYGRPSAKADNKERKGGIDSPSYLLPYLRIFSLTSRPTMIKG